MDATSPIDKSVSERRLFPVARRILEAESFAVDASGKLLRYAGGAYRPNAEGWVRARVKAVTAETWSRGLAEDVLEYIRVDRPPLWERPPLDVVNLRNGRLRVLDEASEPIPFKRLKLEPHDPSWLSTVQLPVDFDPHAECPNIDHFVSQVFPSDATHLAWEITEYLIRPVTDIQKAVLLLGPGGNGKSTWLSLLVSFLGKQNTSSVSLHKLESDRFSAARIYGKLANICPDLPSEHLASTSVFKKVTGGDQISAECKFKDQFDFTPFARLIFSANTPPRSQDSTQGFFDRWVVIPFDRPIRGTAQELTRHEVDAKLTSPEELSGMLNRALRALPTLHNKTAFSKPESTLAALAEFRQTTDPMAIWLDQYTIDDPQAFVPINDLRGAYNRHLQCQGRSSVSEKAFGAEIRKYRPTLGHKEGKRQKKVGGKLVWCYMGIALSHLGEHATESSLEGSPRSLDSLDSLGTPYLLSRG